MSIETESVPLEDPARVRVKICGIRRVDDGVLALESGAWALGFIFHERSPRHLEVEEASDLLCAIRERVDSEFLAVGVFVDRKVEFVQDMVNRVGLDVAQLHGRETPEEVAAIQAREVWKAFRVGPTFDVADLDRYGAAQRILLDTYRKGAPGGTGETFDWDLAKRAQVRRPIILAGGIGAANVRDAIDAVRPQAVDVSSLVESEPGRKDPERIRELFRVLRS